SCRFLDECREGGYGRFERFDLLRGQISQPGGEPCRAARADEAQHALSLLRQLEADSTPILAAEPAEEPRALEPPNLDGDRCRRHALLLGELADADAGPAADRDEERDLAARDAERMDLATELAPELQQDRAQRVRDCDRLGDLAEIVNTVNYTWPGCCS